MQVVKKRSISRISNDRVSSNDYALIDGLDENAPIDKKIACLREQLVALDKGIHPEQLKYSRKIETWQAEQKQRLHILNEDRVERAHEEFENEKRACQVECEQEKKKIQEYMINICEELKTRLEQDKRSIELTTSGDVLETKPQSTRKLRRRVPYGSSGPSSSSGTTVNITDMLLSSSYLIAQSTRFSISSPQPSYGDGRMGGNSPADINVTIDPFEAASSNRGIAEEASGNQFGSLGLNLTENTLLPSLMTALTQNGSSTINLLMNEVSQDESAWLARFPFCSAATAPTSAMTGLLNSYVPPNLAAAAQAKKRKANNNSAQAQLNLQLNEADIYSDLNKVQREIGKPSNAAMNTRKQQAQQAQTHAASAGGLHSNGTDLFDMSSPEAAHGSMHSPRSRSDELSGNHQTPIAVAPAISCWIDDGRLYYKQKCFQHGAPVILEGRDASCHGCIGHIHLIGAQDIAIRRISDHGITKVTVQQLKQGRLKLHFADRRL